MQSKIQGIILFCSALFILSCGEEKPQQKSSSATLPPADALTAQIAKDSTNPELYYQRAKWYLSAKKIKAAENDIVKALSLDSSKASYYLLMADISFSGFHINEAENAFSKSITLDPSNIDAYLK